MRRKLKQVYKLFIGKFNRRDYMQLLEGIITWNENVCKFEEKGELGKDMDTEQDPFPWAQEEHRRRNFL